MVAGTASSRGSMTMETEPRQIECIDEDVDNTNQVIFRYPIIQPLRESVV